MTSAPVTDWPIRLLLVAVVVAVIVGVLLMMRRGWRARTRRFAFLVQPLPIPSGPEADQSIGGVYLGTVTAGDWLDRVTAHGLGTRSRVEVDIHPDGIALHRGGARSFYIPADAVICVHRDRGLAGKAFERDSVVIVTWALGETDLQTGIRPDRGEDSQRLADQIAALTSPRTPGSESPL